MRYRKILGNLKRILWDLQFRIVPNFVWKIYFDLKGIRWIFVLGSTNSGSTLMQQLISKHPDISSMEGEGQKRTRYLTRDNDRLFGFNKERFYLTEHDDAYHQRVYYDWYKESRGSRRIILEKTVSNVMRMRWLQKWFAPAYFIVLIRSPYGVCEGLRRKTSVDIETAAKNWVEIYTVVLTDIKHLRNVILVTYDEFTESTGETMERIRKFVGVDAPFDEIQDENFLVHGCQGRIENMDKRSLARLNEDEIKQIDFYCSDLMKALSLKPISDYYC